MLRKAAYDTVEFWLDVCRRHVHDGPELFRKYSDLGGGGNDVPFAQAFSNLAHAYLRDKAPSLLDHELGFQVVDRSEDNKKAVGIIAAKLGPQKVFVPFFFLKNNVKGHEMLYLCDRDIFVPLKENWLNDLINRKPMSIGTGLDRGEAMRNIASPNLQRLRQSPYKFAGRMADSVQSFLPKMASLVVPDAWAEEVSAAQAHYADRLNLLTFLKQANRQQLGQFVHWLQRYPQLATAADGFYGIDKIAEAVRSGLEICDIHSVHDMKLVPKYRAAPTTGSVWDAQIKSGAPGKKVTVVYFDALFDADGESSDKSELTDDDREKLMKDRVLIQDGRSDDEVSVPYQIKGPENLFNPSESGVYQLLVKPGTFEKCFIALHPYGPDGRKPFATVVRLDDPRSWTNAYSGNLWCSSTLEIGEFDKWFNDLPDAKSLDSGRYGRYVIVGNKGEATLPFEVNKELGDGDDSTLYDVSFSLHCDDRPPGRDGVRGQPSAPSADNYSPYRDGQRIRLGGKPGARLRTNRGDVFVPDGYKLLRVSPAEDEDGFCSPFSATRPLQPGRFVDAEFAIKQKTAELRIMSDGITTRIDGGRPLTKIAALVHLVREVGLREDVARTLLKQAAPGRPVIVRVKQAEPYPYLTDQGPASPSFPDPMQGGYNPMGFEGATTNGQGYQLPIPELSGMNSDPQKNNPNPAYDQAPFYGSPSSASGMSSQREGFDTAMISSLLRTMNDESMVDRWLPDLITGMDRLGRLLFTFYWHGDRFAERYGKRDMPELEDSLRNAFEMLGDVIIFLQQKTVRANPEESLRSLDLGAAASV